MKKNVTVLGCGMVGATLARDLANSGDLRVSSRVVAKTASLVHNGGQDGASVFPVVGEHRFPNGVKGLER